MSIWKNSREAWDAMTPASLQASVDKIMKEMNGPHVLEPYLDAVIYVGTTVAEPAAPASPAAPEDKPKDKPDEDHENKKDLGEKPPHKGPCLRCGNDRALNRLDLCYPCLVKTKLEDAAKERGEVWTESMPHPDTCGCEGLGEHKSAGGASRGNN